MNRKKRFFSILILCTMVLAINTLALDLFQPTNLTFTSGFEWIMLEWDEVVGRSDFLNSNVTNNGGSGSTLSDVFVNESGDTMFGNLTINANLTVQSISATNWSNATVDANQLDFNTTVFRSEEGLLGIVYSFFSDAFSGSDLTDVFVNESGDRMTGNLNVINNSYVNATEVRANKINTTDIYSQTGNITTWI